MKRAQKRYSPSNLVVRALSSLVLVTILLLILLFGEWVFAIPMMVIAMLSLAELHAMHASHANYNDTSIALLVTASLTISVQQHAYTIGIVGFVFGLILVLALSQWQRLSFGQTLQRIRFFALSLLYMGLPFALIALVRQVEPFGIQWAFAAFFNTMGTDTGAYFGGKLFGKTPLMPKHSPNKTWEGALTGLVVGATLASLVLWRVGELTLSSATMTLIASVACIIGDMLESALKRHYTVKDSRLPRLNIFPGHGGVLDRTDGFVFVVYVFTVYLWMNAAW